jgi:hypothetical protein
MNESIASQTFNYLSVDRFINQLREGKTAVCIRPPTLGSTQHIPPSKHTPTFIKKRSKVEDVIGGANESQQWLPQITQRHSNKVRSIMYNPAEIVLKLEDTYIYAANTTLYHLKLNGNRMIDLVSPNNPWFRVKVAAA